MLPPGRWLLTKEMSKTTLEMSQISLHVFQNLSMNKICQSTSIQIQILQNSANTISNPLLLTDFNYSPLLQYARVFSSFAGTTLKNLYLILHKDNDTFSEPKDSAPKIEARFSKATQVAALLAAFSGFLEDKKISKSVHATITFFHKNQYTISHFIHNLGLRSKARVSLADSDNHTDCSCMHVRERTIKHQNLPLCFPLFKVIKSATLENLH